MTHPLHAHKLDSTTLIVELDHGDRSRLGLDFTIDFRDDGPNAVFQQEQLAGLRQRLVPQPSKTEWNDVVMYLAGIAEEGAVAPNPVDPPRCYGMTAADFSSKELLIPVDWNIVAWLRRRGFRIERFGTVQHAGEWIAYPWAETITQAVPDLVGHTRLIVVEIEKPVG